MQMRILVAAALTASVALAGTARASTYGFTFSGPGVSGALNLTYGPATDATYPNAYVVTNITGTISDPSLGLANAPVGPLEPRNFATPEMGNALAPNSFSRFAVAAGLPSDNHGFLTYDNLYWPAGSPPTATDYPVGGGFLDIYGLMFDVGGGRVVDFWSNGDTGSGANYGIAIATSANALAYIGGGLVIPEPASFALLGTGLIALVTRRRPD